MEETISKIPDNHKIPTLLILLELYEEEEDYESCLIIRKELDKYTEEKTINRKSMETFLTKYLTQNKYVELSYHIDMARERAKKLKETLDKKLNINNMIGSVLDEHFNNKE